MSQGSIETSLIVPLGEANVSAILEASERCRDSNVLAVGDFGEALGSIEAALAQRGARLELALNSANALALLAAEAFAFVVFDAGLPEVELEELLRWLRIDRHPARPPIVLLAAGGGDLDRVRLTQNVRARSQFGKSEFWIAHGAHPQALEEQFALLLELHRSRTRASRLEHQLDGARHELAAGTEVNAAIAAGYERAQAELAMAHTKLVQAAKLAALGELVAGVAHEINNPLSFALSHLSTLRRGISRSLASLCEHDPETRAESDRLEERLSSVTLGLDRIKSLVVKLQTFSRLDDGKSHPVDVSQAIGTVLAILQHRLRDRIELTTEFGRPDIIHCDPSLINQSVMNLVVNAIDAVDGLYANASIRIVARAESESYVIRVIDNGHGVPPDLDGKIFEPFFTTKPVGKGTGLGLSIASSVVQKHDGSLTLSPAANGGTEALIRIPLRRVTAPRRR